MNPEKKTPHRIKSLKIVFYTWVEIQNLIKENDIQTLDEYKNFFRFDLRAHMKPMKFYPEFGNAQNFFQVAIMSPDEALKILVEHKGKISMTESESWTRSMGIKHLPRNPRVNWKTSDYRYYRKELLKYMYRDTNGRNLKRESKIPKKAFGDIPVFFRGKVNVW